MLTILGICVFAAAFGTAIWSISATITPYADRIVDALAGRQQGDFQPLSRLVLAERRIAVRRWSAGPRPVVRIREAA